jgi:hypothetical protein
VSNQYAGMDETCPLCTGGRGGGGRGSSAWSASRASRHRDTTSPTRRRTSPPSPLAVEPLTPTANSSASARASEGGSSPRSSPARASAGSGQNPSHRASHAAASHETSFSPPCPPTPPCGPLALARVLIDLPPTPTPARAPVPTSDFAPAAEESFEPFDPLPRAPPPPLAAPACTDRVSARRHASAAAAPPPPTGAGQRTGHLLALGAIGLHPGVHQVRVALTLHPAADGRAVGAPVRPKRRQVPRRRARRGPGRRWLRARRVRRALGATSAGVPPSARHAPGVVHARRVRPVPRDCDHCLPHPHRQRLVPRPALQRRRHLQRTLQQRTRVTGGGSPATPSDWGLCPGRWAGQTSTISTRRRWRSALGALLFPRPSSARSCNTDTISSAHSLASSAESPSSLSSRVACAANSAAVGRSTPGRSEPTAGSGSRWSHRRT